MSSKTETELTVEAITAVVSDADVGRAIRVFWTDSGMTVHGWQDREQMPTELPRVETVGLWMGESDEAVMVGGSHDLSNDNWGECQLIWKPAITGKEWL